MAKAVDNVMAVNAAAIVALPLALAGAPEGLIAAISTKVATQMGVGAAVGTVTSVASVSDTEAPIDQKVNAVMAGAASGALTGPLSLSPATGGVSAVSSRLVSDAVAGQGSTPLAQGVIEFINGSAANYIASAAPGIGVLGQIAVAGVSKYVLDKGADAAFPGSNSASLNERQLQDAYTRFYGGGSR
jgi:hypothetical protein